MACASSNSSTGVAASLRVRKPTAGKRRQRFRVHRVEGLQDAPRPGVPRSTGNEQVARVAQATLGSLRERSTHWIKRTMASKMCLCESAIVRIWHAFGLEPHRAENLRLSRDPQSVERVQDIVGLYVNLPDRAVVVCVNERT